MNAQRLKTVMISVGRLTISLGLAGCAWTLATSGPSAAEQKRSDWREAVVLIERPREGGLPPEIGTGFFVSSEGHILTAAHLLLESNEGDDVVRRRPLNVRLFDAPLARAARILELNRLTDVALLKMKSDERTPFLTLGDSRTVESGELLTLVGHPLGRQEWTVSAAIVDSVTSLERIFLQATLVKGQSGGPAVDEEGNVVGMASYREEGAQQSYLVPINDAFGILAGYVLPSGAVPGLAASSSGVIALPAQAGENISVEEKEPNDFGSEANVAPVGATIRGKLSLENKDSLENSDIIDYLRFTNSQEEPSKVQAIVRVIQGYPSSLSGMVNLEAYFYNADEDELARDQISSSETSSSELPASQSYLVKLRPFVWKAEEWIILYEVVLRPV